MDIFTKLIRLSRGILQPGVKFPTYINNKVTLEKYIKIGKSCHINRSTDSSTEPGQVIIQSKSNLGRENIIKTGSKSIIQIGKDVTIGENNILFANNNSKIKIGSQTDIGDNNIIAAQGNSIISMGRSVLIKNNCKIKAAGGSEYLFQNSSEVLDNSEIISPESTGGNLLLGEHAIILVNNFLDLSDDITIGDDARTGRDVKIHTHIHGIKGKELIWDQPIETKPVFIGAGAWVGTGAQLLPGAGLKDGSILGAGGVLTRSTEEYRVYGGVPARQIQNRMELAS